MYFIIPTLAGQAAIADVIANNTDLELDRMVVGDGNGQDVVPLETMTGLVGLKATIPLQSAVRDGNKVTIEATVDKFTGGWHIREIGLLNTDGQLLFVGTFPATYKATEAETGGDELIIAFELVISATAQVTVVSSSGSYATQEYVINQIANFRTNFGSPIRPYFIAVDSVAVAAAPGSPSLGATYLIPSGASGTWAAHVGKIAQYRGSAGWLYATPPVGMTICDGSTMKYWRLTGDGWREVMATLSEHLAAVSTTLTTNPAGVAAMIDAKLGASQPQSDALSFFMAMM